MRMPTTVSATLRRLVELLHALRGRGLWRSRGVRAAGLLVLVAGALFGGLRATAAISVNSTTTGTFGSLSQFTHSHTVPAGTDRLLIVAVAQENPSADHVTSVTYNGVALAKIAPSWDNNASNEVSLWFLVAPAVGTANVVVQIRDTGGALSAQKAVVRAVNFTGVDQSDPIRISTGDMGTGNAITVTVPSVTNDLVFGVVATTGDASSVTPTVGSGLWEQTTGTAGGDVRSEGAWVAGASSVTMSWTTGASKAYTVQAVSLRPSGAGIGSSAGIVLRSVTAPPAVTAASLTFSHTVPSGNNRALVVTTGHQNETETVNSVTYGGVALAKAADQISTNTRATLWYLLSPTVGTANVVITLSASKNLAALAMNLSGVSQTTPIGTAVGATGQSLTPSATVVSAPSEWVVGALASGGDAKTATANTGQSSLYNTATGTAAGDIRFVTDIKPGAASTSVGWALTASKNWAVVAVPFKPAPIYTISGTVFEDINYGGGAGRSRVSSSGAGVTGATVELYDSTGSLVSATTTAAGGTYSFSANGQSTYYVRVVEGSVLSTRSGSTGSLIGVQTYRTNASTGTAVPVTNAVGGTNPSAGSATAAGTGGTFDTSTFVYNAGISGTAQSVTTVTVGSASISGLDVGFNFDTVVNTLDSGYGSLRQAITNANTLAGDASLAVVGRTAGIEHILFNIATTATGFTGTAGINGRAAITLSSNLPTLSTPMVLDGGTQTTNVSDSNPGLLGAGGTVGADALTLSQVARPEVELIGSAGTSAGLTLAAANITVRGLAIYGIRGTNGSGIVVNSGTSNALIEGNLIGVNAVGADPGASLRNLYGIGTNGGNNVTVQNNYLGYADNAAISTLTGISANWTVQNNEMREMGLAAVAADGVNMLASTGWTLLGNLIVNVSTQAVLLSNQAGSGDMVINNTFTGAGRGSASTAPNEYDAVAARPGATLARIEANIVTGNYGAGIMVSNGASGVAITRNLIYGNGTVTSRSGQAATGSIDIDLLNSTDNNQVGTPPYFTNNDTGDGDSGGNGLQNYPVLSWATVLTGQLEIQGTLNTNANGYYRIEFFASSTPHSTARGGGQVYLGFVNVATDASGNASYTATLSASVTPGTSITATAIKSNLGYTLMSDTSEYAPNVLATLRLSGTVFEDVNYGGGAGRDQASSSGAGVSGARVELYSASGSYVSATTTTPAGAYSFNGLNLATTYFVRVVNSTVLSTRSGSTASLLPVMTYRTETAAGTPAAVTSEVGGTKPVATDAAAGSSGSSLWTSCAAEGATCSFAGTRTVRYGGDGGGSSGWFTRVLTGGTSCSNAVFGDPLAGFAKACYLLNADYQSVSTVRLVSANVSGADFGFNFDTVVNTNDSGAGSLRQAITNANTLGGDASLAQSGRTAAIENLVFMVSNGSSAGGLRSTNNYFSAGVATITVTSQLPSVAAALVLDAQTQPGWALAPVLDLNGAGTVANGITVTAGSGSAVRGMVLRGFSAYALSIWGPASNSSIQGNYLGTNAAGTAASANQMGLLITGSNGNLVGGSTAAQRNIISGNADVGISLQTSSANNTVSGNTIGLNAAGTAKLANLRGIDIVGGASNNLIGGTTVAARNVISGNTGQAVYLNGSTVTGNSIQGNYLGTDTGGTVLMGNGWQGVIFYSGANGNTVGGTAAGAGNLIRGNAKSGVTVAAGSGNAVLGNSIYGNGDLGIDLADDAAINVNDGVKTGGAANLLMDYPVFTSASISGTTLTVAGYVGSAAGQTTFAGARVEVFVSDGSNANGPGQTYLGFLTADASGNFSGTLTGVTGVSNGSTPITATATDGSGNTSEFGPNRVLGMAVSGTVFEDANYGGGAGRNLATSGGTGVSGVTVELYDNSGVFVRSTATASGGSYSFSGLGGGTYYLRVVNRSVLSQRAGSTASLLPVMTYRTTATSGAAVAVTDFVGGTSPSLVDPAGGGSGAAFNTSTYVYSAGLSGTAQSVTAVTVAASAISGLDFGFNFDTVVNTNDSGPGSLRQALTNAETLGGDASLAVSGRTAAVEHVVFMISNGVATAGLRSTNTAFSGGIASIAPASTLPTLANPIVIDAQQQPGWTATPVVELNGSGAGASTNGLTLNGAGSTVRGLAINRYTLNGITTVSGTGLVIEGNHIGTNAAGTAASANTLNGVMIAGGSATIGGLTATTRNLISGNTQNGVSVTGGTATVRGNHIGSNAANSAAIANGASGVLIAGSNSTVGGTAAGTGNVIRGNGGKGVAIANGAYTGNAVLGNAIYGNASLGIDLKADGLTAANDGAKTAGTSNLAMDSPVFTSASISGTTLTLAGYVGSAAGQSTFATSRVEVFVADASSSAGQGQTYLGTLTADASGNFSGTITGITGVSNGSTKITGTATDTSNNSSEFGANVTLGMVISGTVFEDASYGGGAGRNLATSGGTGVSGATLEIYDNSGVFVSSTTSGSGGAYSFSGLAAGTYHLRVVSSSVLSQRSGSAAGLLPVMTYRTTATSGTAVAVTDFVGGTNPAFADPGAASAGATFITATYAYSSGLSGTAHAVAPVTVGAASIGSVDFGFNFDTVSNNNASGPGSLAQVLTNANTLGGDASLAQSGRTAGIENVVFMIPNGTAGFGLRSTFNYFTAGVATISPLAALPSISSALVIDAQTQPGWTANPVVELNGVGAGSSNGLNVAAAGSTVRGLVINRYSSSGIALSASATVQGNWLGVSSSGSTASANGSHGINVTAGTATIGGTGTSQGNVISGNGGAGVWLAGGTAHVLAANRIGVSADGSTRVGNSGYYGVEVASGVNATTIGGTAAGAGNVISGQTGSTKGGVSLCSNSNTVQGNLIGSNAAGTAAVPNASHGILVCSGTTGNVIGGTSVAARNLISGNGGHGISAAGPATVQGNTIGSNAAGTAAIANTGNGIDISVAAAGGSVLVGGTAAGAGNLITGNTGRGVAVQAGAAGNAIQGNLIYGNGNIGIDLNANGVSLNDGAKTAGAGNLLMDSPVFTSARATGSQLVVAGYVGSAPGQSTFASSRVEIYASDNDGTGYGSGKIYLGAVTADSSGNFSATLTLPVTALAIGSKLTATATDTASNTSEFGANFSGLIVDLVVNDKGDATDASAGDGLCATAGGVCTLRAALTELNAWAGLATPPSIVFALPGCSSYGAAACTITPASALPSVTRTVLIDGTTQTGFSTSSYSPIVEISGSAAPGGTTGLVVSASNSTLRGLAINRFPANGITLSGSGNTLVGMRIGLAPATATAAANGGAGVYITGAGNLIGGSTTADRNVIAGNTGAGITVGASSTTISGNLIGTDASATGGLGNGGSGVAVLSASLTGVSISGNTLFNNGAAGVGVAAGGPAQVQILANTIAGNGGLGIDLGNDGVTVNTGVSNISLPNKGMNMPVTTGAGVGSGSTSVTVYGYIGTGTGQAAFAGARVEFFKAAADSSGYGEGLTYLGFLTADANGRYSGTVAYTAGALNVGDALTATATDAAGNTSEFGPNWTSTTVAALTPGSFNAFDAVTSAGALSGTITSKTAGTPASFAVIALDNSGSALHPGFTGTVSLNWVDARDDSGALSGSCRASWVDKGSAGSATFSNNSRVTVALTPPASGTRVMRVKLSYTSGGSTVTACSNDAYAALPASYSWTGASDADSSTAGTARALANTAASGGAVHRAGRPFTVRAQALDATGAVMTGYDGSPVLAAAGCLLPSGCTAASLTAPSTAALAGAYTNSSVSYAEVGALQLQLTDASYANVDAADTLIGVRTLASSLLSVGRFIPDSYSVAVSTSGQLATANAACMASGAGATFIGQAFAWNTTPQVTVTALNAAGATTTRWTGSLMKLAAGSGLSAVLAAGSTGSATFSASYGSLAVSDLGAGQARITASSTDRFSLDLASGSVQDSITPTFAWSLSVSDASEAAVSGNPTLTATANQGSAAFNSGGVFYSARLSLSPGYGDVRSGLRLLAQLQRYTAAGWVTLTDDQGCVTVQNQNVAVETPSGVFSTLGSCAAPMAGSVTTRGGRAWLAFPGTPAGAPGRLTLRLAGPAATGSSCTTAGASAALVNMTQSWLLGGSSGSGPQALATWGKPQRDALLRRETW